MTIRSKRFRKFRDTAVGAMIVASAMTLSSQMALAAIVDSGPVNIPLPQTTAGIYLNFVTGQTSTTGSGFAGYDFNPYLANSGTQLGIYWGPGTVNKGGVDTAAASDHLAILPAGTVVSASLPFTRAIKATTPNFTAGVTSKNIGIQFFNETTGASNFGWVQLSTTGPTGFPAVIERYVYDNTGASITIQKPDLIFFDDFEVPSTSATNAAGF